MQTTSTANPTPTVAATATATEKAAAKLIYELMRKIMLTPDTDHFQVIEEHDLTVSQVRATIMLTCSDPDPLAGGQIAERLGISPAAISRALDGLVGKGFAERRESPADRRVKLHSITAAGRDLADDLVALRRAQIEHFLAELEPGSQARIVAALKPLADSGAIA